VYRVILVIMPGPCPIPHFSRYGCTVDGTVVNLKTGKTKMLSLDGKGCLLVELTPDDGGKRKLMRVSRLVLAAHVEDFDITDPDQTVDHINQIKDDNRLINLRKADMVV
jgi:hypothetical protein